MADPLAEAFVRIRADGSRLGPDIRDQTEAAARTAGPKAGQEFGRGFAAAAQTALDANKAKADLDIVKARQRVDELKAALARI